PFALLRRSGRGRVRPGIGGGGWSPGPTVGGQSTRKGAPGPAAWRAGQVQGTWRRNDRERTGGPGIAMGRSRRPNRVTVNFRGIEHEMNLAICREALVRRQVEGECESMERLAQASGCCRSTASRFFSGRTSLATALAIMDVLKLTFD